MTRAYLEQNLCLTLALWFDRHPAHSEYSNRVEKRDVDISHPAHYDCNFTAFLHQRIFAASPQTYS